MKKNFFSLKKDVQGELATRAALVADKIANGLVVYENFLKFGFAELRGIVATGSRLTELQASHVDFFSCKFDAFDFSESNFDQCQLRKCEFRSNEFVQANFYKCIIGGVEFEQCNFVRCEFFDCQFDEVFFNGCNLTAASFNGCEFKSTNLSPNALGLQETEFVRCTFVNP